MTPEEHDELDALRREMDLHSLGDRPSSIAADKLKRLMELGAKETMGVDWHNQSGNHREKLSKHGKLRRKQ